MAHIYRNILVSIALVLIGIISVDAQEAKPILTFQKKILDYSKDQTGYFRISGDTLYVSFPFTVKGATNDFTFKVYSITPSCTCTGYSLMMMNRTEGTLILKTSLENTQRFNFIDAVIKSNASNDYELVKVRFEP